MTTPAPALSARTDIRRTPSSPLILSVATLRDREIIYRLRHDIYALELGQHSQNSAERLRDPLDDGNIYLVAKAGPEIAGFISLTPPSCPRYSADKYFPRDKLPFLFDDRLYEIRLLSIGKGHRGGELAALLMYAAFRWVESHGGTRIIAIGRREIVDMYLRCGLELAGFSVKSGAVTYDLMHALTTTVRDRLKSLSGLIDRLEYTTDWQLSFPFTRPVGCFHGGAFFDAIGPRFDSLQLSREIINADVLDAWFPPAPGVLTALQQHLPWLLRTSPPTDCGGLVESIAHARGVAPDRILPGAGSSDLIFRALRSWLMPASHALILNPTYGEYAHVLEHVIGCVTDRLTLSRAANYAVDLGRLEAAFADNYDIIILVNPNSPTGSYIPRVEMEAVLRRAPARTRIWIDETYIDYAGPNQSMEVFAAASENIIVCKSMSKVYALSGARAAYLCAGSHQLEALRAITPPWVVSLPAQLAAVRAVSDPAYYGARHHETRFLRMGLAEALSTLGLDVVPGTANFLLCHLPSSGPNAATIVNRCRTRNLFLRDAGAMGSQLGTHSLRIAVKDAETNMRIAQILSEACH